jgi:hypothetical protein
METFVDKIYFKIGDEKVKWPKDCDLATSSCAASDIDAVNVHVATDGTTILEASDGY